MIANDPEALADFREAVKGEHGGDRKSPESIKRSNPTVDRGKAYTLSRLKRETPELFAAVVIEVNRWAVANEARQEAERSRFKDGNQGGPGRPSKTVTENPPSPFIPSRDRKKSDANSTRAKLAKASGVRHCRTKMSLALST